VARLTSAAPGMSFERVQWERGRLAVGGADEVGKGAWAGPLSVGIVVVPVEDRLKGVRDSKLLSPERRTVMADKIRDWAVASAVGSASATECDELGMSQAQKLAARRALDKLECSPDALLADGKWNFINADEMIVKGDRKSLAIAAASILAKVTRDVEMTNYAETYPWYQFEGNKGYPSPSHQAALQVYGPSLIHRTSWRWIHSLPFQLPGRQGRLFD
jgi:ribonuclease HII